MDAVFTEAPPSVNQPGLAEIDRGDCLGQYTAIDPHSVLFPSGKTTTMRDEIQRERGEESVRDVPRPTPPTHYKNTHTPRTCAEIAFLALNHPGKS